MIKIYVFQLVVYVLFEPFPTTDTRRCRRVQIGSFWEKKIETTYEIVFNQK